MPRDGGMLSESVEKSVLTGLADTIRILVASDNHVGFEERDPIRKDDSWRTFDEILELARSEDVDMVLLCGDLFHDNKPSRKALYHVMRSLRRTCLGPRPCELEFLSEAADVFEGAFPHVNYEDPDINVSIPVFSIHGNHDDPSGDGHYCTLDLLQMAGLVNYFGRVPEADNMHVRPLLLQKGESRLALYGMSNVRDERMHRTFRDNKVRFYRPSQHKADFFNLLAVHQNHHAHTSTSYLPEGLLPDFMHLVVWGHEHECVMEPRRNPETGFHVVQPGSSVATSLVPGEAVTKHVGILTITGKAFELEKIPLKTVRPMVTDEITLATDRRFKNVHTKKENRQVLTERLMEIVYEMIDRANARWDSLHPQQEAERPLPLIRLKVEYTPPEGGQYDMENPQRFSNRFAGKVANTNDVIYYHRKKTGLKRAARSGPLSEEAAERIRSMDVVRVDALVEEYFAQQSLTILPQGQFGEAVNDFVSNDDKNAVDVFVDTALKDGLREMLKLESDQVEQDLRTHMESFRSRLEDRFRGGDRTRTRKRRLKPRPEDWKSDLDGKWEDQPGAVEVISPEPEPAPIGKKQVRPMEAGPVDSDDSMANKAEVEQIPARKTAKKAIPRKAPARGRKKPVGLTNSDDDDVVMGDEPAPQKRSQPSRVATRTRQTTLNFSQAKPKATQRSVEISDDAISEDDLETMPTRRARRR